MLPLQCNKVNGMVETFQNKFLSITTNNGPIITLYRKENKLRQKPWLTKGILESITIKNQIYKKDIKKKDNFWCERYKFYGNKVNMVISEWKRNYVRRFFQEVEGNSRKTLTKINILNKKKC